MHPGVTGGGGEVFYLHPAKGVTGRSDTALVRCNQWRDYDMLTPNFGG